MSCLIRSNQERSEQRTSYPLPTKKMALATTARVLGITRSAASIASGSRAAFVVKSQIFPSVIWTFLGAQGIRAGYKELREAQKIGDQEGIARVRMSLLSGGLDVTSSLLSISGFIADSAEVGASVVGSLGYTGGAIFGVGLLISMGISTAGIYRTRLFCKTLGKQLNQQDKTASERCLAALGFLKESFALTEAEKAAIATKINNDCPGLPAEEKESKIATAESNASQAKSRAFKRKTSRKAVALMSQCDALLQKLRTGDANAETEALAFIQAIKKESQKKSLVYGVALIAAAIGIASLIIGTFFTVGALPLILGIISTTIYLGISVANYIQYVRDKRAELSN